MDGLASFDLQENLICYPVSELDMNLNREWKTWMCSTQKRLHGLRKGLKETPSSRIDRLKAVPAEVVIRCVEATQARTRQAIRAGSLQHGSGSKHPELKPKSTVDFLFKYCEMKFKDALELLDQLRDQQQTKGQEQTKSKGQRLRRSIKIGM